MMRAGVQRLALIQQACYETGLLQLDSQRNLDSRCVCNRSNHVALGLIDLHHGTEYCRYSRTVRAGVLTCTELTQRLLHRIACYDQQGPCLHALVSVHPHALDTARYKDREHRSNPAAVGPLHGIPVLFHFGQAGQQLGRHIGGCGQEMRLPVSGASP
jgi:hypothetical protein